MLQVIFSYKNEQPIYETMRSLQYKFNEDAYIFNGFNYTGKIIHDASNKKLTMTFSKELSFEQYKHIHKTIKAIKEAIIGQIDDSLAFMGYLKDGEEAFIYHNWDQWLQLLEGAKHVSMEGQKVEVYENSEIKGKGILISTKIDEEKKDDFTIVSCKIITKSGEKTLTGKQLRIVATGEF